MSVMNFINSQGMNVDYRLCTKLMGINMNLSAQNEPTRFYDSWFIRIGVAWLVFGSGPLLFVILADKPVWTCNPYLNPVGLGILAGVTLWPTITFVTAGIISVLAAKKSQSDQRN